MSDRKPYVAPELKEIAAEDPRAVELLRECTQAGDLSPVGARLARAVFAHRGNHTEIHLQERELAQLFDVVVKQTAAILGKSRR